jgi:RNA polymerase sigma-70 factor (ECF subfamily)
VDADLELLERWCDGETEAGNTLFKRHFRSVYCFFEHKAGNDVDELVQETFLACVKSRDRFEGRSSFRTYLFSIARYTLYGYWRRRHRRGEALDFCESSLADLATTPRSRIAREQERETLLAALSELPLEQQLILELHYWEELSSKELAEVFDVAVATTRSRLFRARQALREKLEQIGAPVERV